MSIPYVHVDHVIRREHFQERHPEVTILSPRQVGGSQWLATWDEANGSTTITRRELRDLLDALELRFPG